MPIVDKLTTIIAFVQKFLRFLRRGKWAFCGSRKSCEAHEKVETREKKPLLQQHGIQDKTPPRLPLYLRGYEEAEGFDGSLR